MSCIVNKTLNKSVQTTTREGIPDFDYELVQAIYFNKCEEYFKQTANITGPWTNKVKSEIIESIKNHTPLSILKYNLQSRLDELYKCQVALENGVEKLVLADGVKEYLSFEECFDIFVDMHLKTDHGDFGTIKNILTDKFFVPSVCLKFFLTSCNYCNRYKYKAIDFNDHVLIEILEAPIQDEPFKYMLAYIDTVTQLKIFKPLISMDKYELSVELLKIFTDYGPPVCIDTMHLGLFRNVLSLLSQGGFTFYISLNHTSTILGNRTLNPSDPYSLNWSIMCRINQYSNNNGTGEKNAFSKVFYNYQEGTQLTGEESEISLQDNDVCIIDETDPLGKIISDTDDDSSKEDSVDNDIDDDVVFFNETKKDLIPELDSSTIQTTKSSAIVDGDEMMSDVTKDEGISTEMETSLDVHWNPKEELATELNKNIQDLIKSENESNTSNDNDITKDEIDDGSSDTNTESENRYCSDCKGKMLTDYSCFHCKKYTHIFCLTFKTEKRGGKIIGFSYCQSCMKSEKFE